jgi:hypothetical protein
MSNQSPTENGRDQGPAEPFDQNSQKDGQNEERPNKGHGPLKGTDTPATTDADLIQREKGKRTTM